MHLSVKNYSLPEALTVPVFNLEATERTLPLLDLVRFAGHCCELAYLPKGQELAVKLSPTDVSFSNCDLVSDSVSHQVSLETY